MENLFTLKVMVVYIFNLGEGWFSSLLQPPPFIQPNEPVVLRNRKVCLGRPSHKLRLKHVLAYVRARKFRNSIVNFNLSKQQIMSITCLPQKDKIFFQRVQFYCPTFCSVSWRHLKEVWCSICVEYLPLFLKCCNQHPSRPKCSAQVVIHSTDPC